MRRELERREWEREQELMRIEGPYTHKTNFLAHPPSDYSPRLTSFRHLSLFHFAEENQALKKQQRTEIETQLQVEAQSAKQQSSQAQHKKQQALDLRRQRILELQQQRAARAGTNSTETAAQSSQATTLTPPPPPPPPFPPKQLHL